MVTNSLLTGWVAVIILIIIAVSLRKRLSIIPLKLQILFEIIIEQGLEIADLVTNSRKLSLKIFPIAITIFFLCINYELDWSFPRSRVNWLHSRA